MYCFCPDYEGHKLKHNSLNYHVVFPDINVIETIILQECVSIPILAIFSLALIL